MLIKNNLYLTLLPLCWMSGVLASPAIDEKAALQTVEAAVSHPCARYSAKKLSQRAEPYQDAITQYAERYGIETAVIKAVIAIESCYNQLAESPKGAKGLMQLIPGTAERFGVSNSFDTTQNIQGGTRYLSWLSKRYDGNLTKMLAAYNAGEGKVDRYDGIPPYKETQHYVRNVLTVYHKLSGKPEQESGFITAAVSMGSKLATSTNTNTSTNTDAGTNAEMVAGAMRALLQPPAETAPPTFQPIPVRLPMPAVSAQLGQPTRVRAVFRSPLAQKPAPAPIRPSKPGRGGLHINKARAPQLYKQPGGPNLLADATE